jgi:hypothetical protein
MIHLSSYVSGHTRPAGAGNRGSAVNSPRGPCNRSLCFAFRDPVQSTCGAIYLSVVIFLLSHSHLREN